jgi:hypothetical protein
VSREHSRQVCCASSAGDDTGEAAIARLLTELCEQLRRAVCRDYACFKLDTELLEAFGCMLHDRPVTGTAHYYCH